jgi:hypothetical protein
LGDTDHYEWEGAQGFSEEQHLQFLVKVALLLPVQSFLFLKTKLSDKTVTSCDKTLGSCSYKKWKSDSDNTVLQLLTKNMSAEYAVVQREIVNGDEHCAISKTVATLACRETRWYINNLKNILMELEMWHWVWWKEQVGHFEWEEHWEG